MKTKVVVLCAVFGIICARAQTAGPGAGTPASKTPAVGTSPATAPAAPAQADGPATNAGAGGLSGATNGSASATSVAPSGSVPIVSVPANPAEPMRDQALNPTDANLLRQIRQTVFAPGQPGAESVHFVLMNGAVRVTGNVPTAEEQKRIDAAVSRIPGVTKVYDALAVAGGATARAPASTLSTNAGATPLTGSPGATNALPPTGRPTGVGSTNTSGRP